MKSSKKKVKRVLHHKKKNDNTVYFILGALFVGLLLLAGMMQKNGLLSFETAINQQVAGIATTPIPSKLKPPVPCNIVGLGDVNMDGYVDLYDVTLLQSFLVGASTPNAVQKVRGDINGDGKLASGDLAGIKAYTIRQISTFPACSTAIPSRAAPTVTPTYTPNNPWKTPKPNTPTPTRRGERPTSSVPTPTSSYGWW